MRRKTGTDKIPGTFLASNPLEGASEDEEDIIKFTASTLLAGGIFYAIFVILSADTGEFYRRNGYGENVIAHYILFW